jgi:hypothetical protein
LHDVVAEHRGPSYMIPGMHGVRPSGSPLQL